MDDFAIGVPCIFSANRQAFQAKNHLSRPSYFAAMHWSVRRIGLGNIGIPEQSYQSAEIW